jgi:methionyl-tRNA formyltransferase
VIENAIFLGSKKFGFELFKALYEADETVSWTVLCPPDLSDLRTYFDEFSNFTKVNNIDLLSAASPEMILQFAEDHRPDVMIVCGYYRILPSKLFELINEGVWGIHNSLLPKYRGGAPLVWQIINREQVLGSTFFKFDDGVDDGPVLDQVTIENTPSLTIAQAGDLIEHEWVKRVPKLWKDFCSGKLVAEKQNHDEATYCAQRKEFDGEITWRKDALYIDSFIRAQAHPYPRAFFNYREKKVKIVKHETDVRVVYGSVGQVFEVREDFVTICCGENSVLRLIELEVDGTLLKAREVLNSIKVRIG